MRTLAVLSVAAILAATALPVVAKPPAIAAAVADASRPADDRKIDGFRKPEAILAFGGVKRGQVVADFLPGGGYYTRLFSDVVGPKGKVYALETTRWGQENIDSTKAVLKEPNRQNVSLDLSPFGDFKLAEKVDAFFTNQNYHDPHIVEYGKVDMLAFNKHVFDALKPGGIYVIIDHAAAPGADDKVVAALHRIDKAVVIREVTAAGFVLVGESDVLKAPADDHTKGVFDKTIRYHTDQFILKFRKPK